MMSSVDIINISERLLLVELLVVKTYYLLQYSFIAIYLLLFCP